MILTSKTPYLAIDERALGNQRAFVCLRPLSSKILYLLQVVDYVSLLSVMKFVSAVLTN